VSQGRAVCSPEVMPGVIQRLAELQRANGSTEPLQDEPLSDRETEVLQLMALGLSDKAISRRLGIKATTAKSHVRNVLRGLRLRRRWDIDLRRTARRRNNGEEEHGC
jgi:DNA-binding NarL/FixJ family response regulator